MTAIIEASGSDQQTAGTFVSDDTSVVTDNTTEPYVIVKTWKFWLPLGLTTGLYFVIAIWLTASLFRDYLYPGNRRLPRMKKWIKIVSLGCSVISAFAFLSDWFEEIVVDYFAHNLCTATMYAKVAIGRSAFSLSYLVFWLRQRSIYSNPALRDFTSPFLRAASWAALSISLAFPFIIFGMRTGASTFAFGLRGCGVVFSTIPSGISWYLSSIASVVTQFCLLWPFVRPLMNHTSEMREDGVKLKPVIIRSLVCASVCAGTDIVAFTICSIDAIRNGFIIGTSVQGSIVINMIAVVVAFPNWKKIVFPCRKARDKQIDGNVVRIPSIATNVNISKKTDTPDTFSTENGIYHKT